MKKPSIKKKTIQLYVLKISIIFMNLLIFREQITEKTQRSSTFHDETTKKSGLI